MISLIPIVSALIICLPKVNLFTLEENDFCNDGRNWKCQKFDNCPWAISEVKKGNKPTICKFVGLRPLVCCPPGAAGPRPPKEEVNGGESEMSRVKPVQLTARPQAADRGNRTVGQTKCLEYRSLLEGKQPWPAKYTYARADAAPKEFPHSALVGYDGEQGTVSWICGGSLISERFTMTAAHCAYNSKGTASWVRLGDLDIESIADDAKPIILRIIKRFVHPSFVQGSYYNDIALLKLERNIAFSDYIRPICLPDEQEAPSTLFSTGWEFNHWGGKPRKHLQKLLFHSKDTQDCAMFYSESKTEFPEGIMPSSQLCMADIGIGACQGDAGGPLQFQLHSGVNMYMQLGIGSYAKGCGQNIPGVYTKVLPYVPWIEKITWNIK